MNPQEIEEMISRAIQAAVSATMPQYAPLVGAVQDIVSHLLPGAPTLAQHKTGLDSLAKSIATQAEESAK